MYLKYWTLNLNPPKVYPKVLFPRAISSCSIVCSTQSAIKTRCTATYMTWKLAESGRQP